MKKTLLFLSISLYWFSTVLASGIDSGHASKVAQNFYQQLTGKKITLNLAYQALNTQNNGVALNEPLYYAFNVTNGKGFIIVSADDLVKPILGYSTESQFSIQNAPAAVSVWLQKYCTQIALVKVNQLSADMAVTMQWQNLYSNTAGAVNQLKSATAVGPLLTTAWDQDLFYNALCPTDGNSPYGYGGNVPTGCGATAMSQIMRYWSYPAQGTGTNSYGSNYGTLSANFGSTSYNWANMPNSVTSANNEVATIMYDCGVAVDMVYGPDESSSYMLSAGGVAASCQAAYTTFFGYDPNSMQGVEKANFTESNWLSMIQTELNANRPIQYAGQGPQGGHTFVLDGSDGNGNFHINWGWSGTDNGYYSIDALTPGPQANGDYSEEESMLIGIQPLNVTPVASGIDLFLATTVNPNPILFLTPFTVTTNVVNDGSAAFNGLFCAALFDASGNFIRYIGDIIGTNGSALPATDHYTNNLTFTDTSQGITAPGTYTIGIYYEPTGSNIWTLAGQNGFTNPISVTISGPVNSNISLYSDIQATPATLVQGQPATITVNVINNGSAAYTGNYEAVLLDLNGDFVEQLGVITEANGLQVNNYYLSPYLQFTANSITAPEGEYFLAIAEEESGTSTYYYCGGQTYQNPVLIGVINSGFTVGIQEKTASALKVYPNPASNNITIDAGDARGDFALKIYNTVGQTVTDYNGVLNGQSLSTDVSSFAAGMYVIELKTTSGTLNAKVVVK